MKKIEIPSPNLVQIMDPDIPEVEKCTPVAYIDRYCHSSRDVIQFVRKWRKVRGVGPKTIAQGIAEAGWEPGYIRSDVADEKERRALNE